MRLHWILSQTSSHVENHHGIVFIGLSSILILFLEENMKSRLFIALVIPLLLALFVHSAVSAHGKTTVGDYDLEIGFHNEPVVIGMPNSLDLFVTNSKTGEKVNNLQGALKAELIFGASKKSFKLEPQEGQDGAYTAYVIPSATGDYTWHITGKINDTPVDVSMTSSPDTFNSAEDASVYAFPGAGASGPDPAAQAATTSNTALLVGGGGLVIGLIGLVIGLVALSTARRQKS
jgi:hypothetical protein